MLRRQENHLRLLRRRDGRAGGFDLDAFRAAIGDANLLGIYSRDNARVNGSGAVALIEDARVTKLVGRLLVPPGAGNYVSLGNQPILDAATKLTVLTRQTPQNTISTRTMVARSQGSNAATSQFDVKVTNGALLAVSAWDGAALTLFSRAGVITVGTDYQFGMVFDGTLGTVADRFKLTADPITQGGVKTGAVLSSVGGTTAPAALSTSTLPVTIGGINTGAAATGAPIDTVAIYVGRALSAAEIDAEFANGYANADHRYTFDGTLSDSGKVGGWDGTALGNGLLFCSDDNRWGPPIIAAGGSQSPLWDSGNREAQFDGFDDWMMAVLRSTFDVAAVGAGMATICTPGAAGSGKCHAIVGTTASDQLTLYRIPSGNMVESTNATNLGAAPGGPGTRAFHSRRTLNTIGYQDGSAAEVSGATADATALATIFRLGCNRAASPGGFTNLNWRGSVLYKGDYAGKQALVNQFAAALGATL